MINMKEVLYNYDNLAIDEIDEVVIRTKALIINDNDEITLGYSNGTYQFPGGHLESGEELTDCIQDWLKGHCVDGNYNLSDGTESFAQFEQVRIPLLDERGNALDARGFATQLRKYLNKAPYNITAKVMQRGLGEAIIVLGEK